jgi:hypothetical protein
MSDRADRRPRMRASSMARLGLRAATTRWRPALQLGHLAGLNPTTAVASSTTSSPTCAAAWDEPSGDTLADWHGVRDDCARERIGRSRAAVVDAAPRVGRTRRRRPARGHSSNEAGDDACRPGDPPGLLDRARRDKLVDDLQDRSKTASRQPPGLPTRHDAASEAPAGRPNGPSVVQVGAPGATWRPAMRVTCRRVAPGQTYRYVSKKHGAIARRPQRPRGAPARRARAPSILHEENTQRQPAAYSPQRARPGRSRLA